MSTTLPLHFAVTTRSRLRWWEIMIDLSGKRGDVVRGVRATIFDVVSMADPLDDDAPLPMVFPANTAAMLDKLYP